MPNSLFFIPSNAQRDSSPQAGFPAGGEGGGHFVYTPSGDFRQWNIHPQQPIIDEPVPSNQFHLWWEQKKNSAAYTLNQNVYPQYQWGWNSPFQVIQHRLFPFSWKIYEAPDSPLQLESLALSPILSTLPMESTFPVYLVIWRVKNISKEKLEAALMLTWAHGIPDLVPKAVFDLQHDRLCLTGALGDPKSANRQGIAMPDLHFEGIYLQGIEPWEPMSDGAELWEDFADDGELEPTIVGEEPQGAAAWVKFDLRPGEMKEIPFVLAWHYPQYEYGAQKGEWRPYTHYLGRNRPDNAIVWLAEQAVQDYGTESANYKHWIRQIEDWQASH